MSGQRGPPTMSAPTGAAAVGSVLDRDAHGPGGAGDDLLGGLNVVGVEVGHLLLGDVAQLGAGHAAHLGALRRTGALGDTGGLDEQARGRRRLEDEAEGPVLVDADLGGDDVAALSLGLGVV